MCEANKMIERTRFSSPSLEDLINTLQGSKIYCKLDMNNLASSLQPRRKGGGSRLTPVT